MENITPPLADMPAHSSKAGMIGLAVAMLVIGLVAGYYLGSGKSGDVVYQTATPTVSIYASPSTSQTPSVSATPNTITDWKTYSYPQFGYSFKIPAALFIRVEGISTTDGKYSILQRIVTSYDERVGEYLGPGFLVLSATSLEDGIKKIISGATPITNRQQVMIGDRQWTSFNLGIMNGETDYVLYLKNRLYIVGGNNTDYDLLKLIASTYLFTN